jgi:hypothetical protein
VLVLGNSELGYKFEPLACQDLFVEKRRRLQAMSLISSRNVLSLWIYTAQSTTTPLVGYRNQFYQATQKRWKPKAKNIDKSTQGSVSMGYFYPEITGLTQERKEQKH